LEKGDVIVELDGTAIENTDDLLQAIIRSAVGESVAIVYVRGDDRLTTTAQLRESPPPWD